MARVTGIGGVFLRSPNPQALAQWYMQHLGIKLFFPSGTVFKWSDEVPAGTGKTAWSVFPEDSQYLGERVVPDGPLPSAMINYRVDDLDALLLSLTAAGVWVDPKREASEYGRFAWIRDCDGNRLELWQPPA